LLLCSPTHERKHTGIKSRFLRPPLGAVGRTAISNMAPSSDSYSITSPSQNISDTLLYLVLIMKIITLMTSVW